MLFNSNASNINTMNKVSRKSRFYMGISDMLELPDRAFSSAQEADKC